ncbi:unnamed protein product [Lymnaea stagnalis]|uniref:Uncharacterized protein n=1 Tax=Lymnaea stagnalis TaxID=6523 RepID=A0AAV2HXH6_LYMST
MDSLQRRLLKELLFLSLVFIPLVMSCQRKPDLHTTHQTTAAASTTRAYPPGNTTAVIPVTLSPSQQARYLITLINSGPAILDSMVLFSAKLTKLSGNDYDPLPVQFNFQWMNMANIQMNKTKNNFTSQISMRFSSPSVSAGEYTMTVAAFPSNDSTKMVAYETMKFVLTDNLNGHMIFRQPLDYQRFPHVFATSQPITIAVDIHDKFSQGEDDFEYIWFMGEQFISQEKILTTSFDAPMQFFLKTLVSLKSKQSVYYVNNDHTHKSPSDNRSFSNNQLKPNTNYESHIISSDLSTFDEKCQSSKCGQFEEFVIFKDSLKNCSIKRLDDDHDNKEIPLGTPALFNISCLGSAPSGVCFNVTFLNGSVPSYNACTPVIFSDTVQHLVKVELFNAGWAYVHFFIYNDISRKYMRELFYGYDPESVNVPALIFPIIFILIGIVILLVGAAYMMRLRKKPQVEVADFDFHPNLTNNQSRTSEYFSRVVCKIKNMFPRTRHDSNNRESESTIPLCHEESSAHHYNSLL